jgi:hypothetical protein
MWGNVSSIDSLKFHLGLFTLNPDGVVSIRCDPLTIRCTRLESTPFHTTSINNINYE